MTVLESMDFVNYSESVPRLLDALDMREVFAKKDRILIKPNLVCPEPHPVTTAPAFCRALIEYIRAASSAEVVIAEGTGEPGDSTLAVFEKLGYNALCRDFGVDLIDLNEAPLMHLENPDCSRLPELYLPRIAETHWIISLPVLKAHSLAGFTGSHKNMMGFLPPAHYAGAGGIWNKAALHQGLQQAIRDLNRYRSPDFTIMDASIGMPDQHLGGRHCDPPVAKLVGGFAAGNVDRFSAELLGIDWRAVAHLRDDS
jgi:uncharacterized protein (DUF362 family)